MGNVTLIPAVTASLILLLLFSGMSYYDRITTAAVAAGDISKRNFQLVDAICVSNTAKFIFKNMGGGTAGPSENLFRELDNGNVGKCGSCHITNVMQPEEFVQGYCYNCPGGQHVFQIDANEQAEISLAC